MNKIIWIDTETTGLSAYKNDIIQIAALVEIDGVLVDKLELKCQPFSFDNIDQKALNVHGYQEHQLALFDNPLEVQQQFTECLKKYISPYDRADKAYFAGYNTKFDFDFVREWFKKSGDKYFGSFFQYKMLDVFPLYMAYCQAKNWYPKSHKLVDAAEHFGLKINAHDAMSDIEVTREVYLTISELIKRGGESCVSTSSN